MELISHVKKFIKAEILFLNIFLIALISFLDILTGYEVSFSFFYLIPVVVASWYLSRNAGIIFSFASALLWLGADFEDQHPYSNILIPYWNCLIRLGIFLIISFTISIIKRQNERKKEINNFIVHDLRSPLSSILSGFNLMKDEPLTENQSELVDFGISSGNKMLLLINSMLDIERIENKRVPINITKINIEEVLNLSKKYIYPLIIEKNIAIDTKVDILDRIIYADKDLTLRILLNLLSNAVKASKPNSQISILVYSLKTGEIIISVKDSGSGIPKSLVNKIFSKYFQIQNGNFNVQTGSGIGLAFCRLAVESLGGKIWAESEVGEGTTISFSLPQNIKA
jgi:signal transduction histidine kinase